MDSFKSGPILEYQVNPSQPKGKDISVQAHYVMKYF